MKAYFTSVSSFFRRWFHKRNIIIISERKVKHIPISGRLQFITLMLIVSGVCWASYSTGSFMAARLALKQQGQALRSVTNAHIETSFNALLQPQPVGKTASAAAPYVPAPGPVSALSALDNAQLVARIKILENKVVELKNTNETIVERVQAKTSGRLDDLETIIKQTGLNLSELKKNYKSYANKSDSDNESKQKSSAPSEGGPYIPDETTGVSPQEKEMLTSLDDLALLNKIVNHLPLASPIENAEEQSLFGHRIDPINGHLAFHSGLDLSGPTGSKIYSAADGKIIAAGRNGAYGNAIDIDHGFGIVTRYGHLSSILVQDGQMVKKGDVIGIQGSTGRATGPHLHYEVRYHDEAMNPKKFLDAGLYVSQN